MQEGEHASPPITSAELSDRGRQIVAAARELLDHEGLDALTMRRLADAVSVRAPSLYNHLPSKEALHAALISDGFEEFGAVLDAAVDSADDPLGAMCAAYRSFALAHPHLYRLMTEQPLDRHLLRPGSEERGARAVVDAAGGDRDLARACWAFAHGMTVLELNSRFPSGADLEAAWARGIAAFRRPTA
jgi:AcrR family transcriptional regulator